VRTGVWSEDDLAHVHLQWFAPEDEGKTEEPTEYRLRKEREEGRVPKRPDLVAAIGLLLTSITLSIVGPWMLVTLREMARWFLTVSTEIDPTTEGGMLGGVFLSYFSRLVLPMAVVAMVSGIFGNVLQTGFMFTTKPLKPDLKKIVPRFGQYFKRTLLSGEALFNLAKSLFKISLIGIVAYLNIDAETPRLARLYTSTIWNSVGFVSGIVARIIIEAAILMLVLSIPDYIFQRRQFRKRLQMTKQEVKEERKMFEGDPVVKGRLKERMRDIMSRNMAVNVPKADVVVTNPTHFAIAIEFDPLTMAVPTITAKGADEMAFRIRQLAKDAGVPIVENRPLARALYAEADVGEAVPEAYYEAISKILAHIAKIDARVAAKYASMGT